MMPTDTAARRATEIARARARKQNPKRKIFDWISQPRPENATPFQKFILDIDWEKSPLGPMEHWPNQLKQMVLLVVQDPSPAVVYWGDEATIVYNEAYTQLIGSKHPALQGQDPRIEFAEIWDHFENLLMKQRETAQTTVEANAFLLLRRHGFFEETYFSWKFVPIIGEDGWVVGSHATVVEVTREVISDRRLGVVRNLSTQLSGAKTIKDLWHRILLGIEVADKDIPLALLYSIEDAISASSSSPGPNGTRRRPPSMKCRLEGVIGLPSDHPLAPVSLDLEDLTNPSPLASALRKSLQQTSLIVVPIEEILGQSSKDIDWRGHGRQPSQIVACPIIPTESDDILGFLVLALNPHRPFDDDYRGFLHLLTQQVTQPQLSAVILREEVERRQQVARQEAIDRARLSRELSESETKFARFARRAPIGLAILTADGLALSANPLWTELTGLSEGSPAHQWAEVLTDGEFELVMDAWARLITEKQPITIQTKMRRPWRAPDLDNDGKEQWSETSILLAMYPDTDENEEVFSVMSCITDVSELKWSENQLRWKMDQAIEMKKQQERFIDMTSHEMRNPLSALIGCADEIIANLNEYRLTLRKSSTHNNHQRSSSQPYHVPHSQTNSRTHSPTRTPSPSTLQFPSTFGLTLNSSHPNSHTNAQSNYSLHLLDEAVEAADTIIYCAMHQKRIIDDILTLSRLDSNLLLVSPEPSQPILLVRSALKMFEAELKRASTCLTFIEESSLGLLGIEWTLLDPSRVLQVLINLMTNAIKFTRTEKKREIRITMGASLTRPSEENKFNVKYVCRSSSTSIDQTTKPEWGDGEILYLCITVEDTGRGLTPPEMANLFHLFAQASPKTHQTYGGSGLGLFISRQLVNMQGGEVGVASTAGEGSTFQFYVKTRRTHAPAKVEERKDFQLLVREDALREACAVEISSLQNGAKMSNVQPEEARPTPPRMPQDRKGKKGEGFHILVVEDNLVNQKVVSKQLRKEGHVVSVANHGEEALDFIRRSEFWDEVDAPSAGEVNGTKDENETKEKGESGERLNVVLMDLEMPVMDGITCVKRIRELQIEGKIKRHVPVIAVTANARKDQILRSLDAGMDDVTTKPYRMTDMLKQIEKLVARHTIASSVMPVETA